MRRGVTLIAAATSANSSPGRSQVQVPPSQTARALPAAQTRDQTIAQRWGHDWFRVQPIRSVARDFEHDGILPLCPRAVRRRDSPADRTGAMAMKMISSTSSTSIMGVILIAACVCPLPAFIAKQVETPAKRRMFRAVLAGVTAPIFPLHRLEVQRYAIQQGSGKAAPIHVEGPKPTLSGLTRAHVPATLFSCRFRLAPTKSITPAPFAVFRCRC